LSYFLIRLMIVNFCLGLFAIPAAQADGEIITLKEAQKIQDADRELRFEFQYLCTCDHSPAAGDFKPVNQDVVEKIWNSIPDYKTLWDYACACERFNQKSFNDKPL